MKFSWRIAAAMLCSFLGLIGWGYVGAYMILTRPVKGLLLMFLAGEFSLLRILTAVIQGFVYLSLGGAVWCIGYMCSDYFKSSEKERRKKLECGEEKKEKA